MYILVKDENTYTYRNVNVKKYSGRSQQAKFCEAIHSFYIERLLEIILPILLENPLTSF